MVDRPSIRTLIWLEFIHGYAIIDSSHNVYVNTTNGAYYEDYFNGKVLQTIASKHNRVFIYKDLRLIPVKHRLTVKTFIKDFNNYDLDNRTKINHF